MDTINEEINILTEFIKKRYGDHLNESQLDNISKSIGHQIQDSKDLSRIKLNNNMAPFSLSNPDHKDTRWYQ
tara:strand:+ start:252 stop:467 length:216 start_codon:yes stop_codon:yes gene_type:complete